MTPYGRTLPADSLAGGRPAPKSAPGYDPFSLDRADRNLLIGNEAIDSVSGSVPRRADICQIRLAE